MGALCAKILLQSRRSSIRESPYSRLGLAGSLFATPDYFSSLFPASSDTKILVTCYTNHALDQFLEDLINIGIPRSEIVRIGSKANQATADLSLQSLKKSSGFQMSRYDWEKVEDLREVRNRSMKSLQRAYSAATARHRPIMDYLATHHPKYAAAFRVPESKDKTQIVGKGGKAIGPNYLLDRWLKGQDAGVLKNEYQIQASGDIWKMEHAARRSQSETWRQEVVKKGIEDMLRFGKSYNQCVASLDSIYGQGEASILRQRRIIGCTTTGAAMYRSEGLVPSYLSLC